MPAAQGLNISRFESLFQNAPVAMLTIDRNGVIVDVNEIAARLTGYPLASLRGMAVDLLVPTTSQGSHEHLRDRFWNEENASRVMAENRDVSMLHANGTTLPVEISLVRLSDEGHDEVVLASLVDVTERYHARSLLEEQTQQVVAIRDELETVLNAAKNAIIAFDETGQILRINSYARHMLGGISTPTPFPWPDGIRFLEAETLKPLDASADPVRRALSGHILRSETHLMRRTQAGADRRYVRMDSAQVEGDESTVHTVLVIDDVSSEERNRQVVERKSRLDALGQLTGGIAHDFNNLLAALLYSVDLAGRAKDPIRREDHLSRALRSIDRGRSLTSRLLLFARKQPGLATTQSIQKVFEDFQKLLRPMLEANIAFSYEMESDDYIVFCDQAQLETALMNLVLNSRDAILRSGSGSFIKLQARAVSASEVGSGGQIEHDRPLSEDGKSLRYIEIGVADDGPGMDAETLARSTDPFFTTKDTNSGTGLGLAMVYGFVRQSDGDLRIYSEEGIGTTVKIVLPRGTSHGTREDPVEDDQPVQGSGQTVLLVEDEPELLAVMTELLESIGYEVVSAMSGQLAIEHVENRVPFDLLLTDVVMPGKIGGFELAHRIRQLRPDVPVVYLSGYTGFTANEMGEVQAPILQKPAPPVELAEVLHAQLHRD